MNSPKESLDLDEQKYLEIELKVVMDLLGECQANLEKFDTSTEDSEVVVIQKDSLGKFYNILVNGMIICQSYLKALDFQEKVELAQNLADFINDDQEGFLSINKKLFDKEVNNGNKYWRELPWNLRQDALQILTAFIFTIKDLLGIEHTERTAKEYSEFIKMLPSEKQVKFLKTLEPILKQTENRILLILLYDIVRGHMNNLVSEEQKKAS